MAEFKKKSRAKTEIPMASMPDIIFILLIFFMVTTVMRTTTLKVQVKFAHAKNIEKIEQKRLVSYIFIGPEKAGKNKGKTAVQIDDAIIDNLDVIPRLMYDKLMAQPKLIVSLRVDRTSEMGVVYDVQQKLRKAGTLRINYSAKPRM